VEELGEEAMHQRLVQFREDLAAADDGVHVLHRWREGDGALPEVIGQVGHAILFTTLSTALSFSVLLALNHNGFFGLAVLAMLGVGGCFLASIASTEISLSVG
jgi:predicted RND superfamily exporter protein